MQDKIDEKFYSDLLDHSFEIQNFIHDYYESRKLKWPNPEEAMMFLMTEVGEAFEAILHEKGGWVRNNPRVLAPRFLEELGDIIMMAIVAGMATGRNPLTAMLMKMQTKLRGLEKEEA